MNNFSKLIKNSKENIESKSGLFNKCLNGSFKISVIDNNEIWIENFRGIIGLETDCILIQANNFKVMIKGKKLTVVYYTNEDMKIVGKILEILYL